MSSLPTRSDQLVSLIAMVILTPALALLVRDRRVVLGALVAVWALILAPQTHQVLLEEQLTDRSYFNTASYFLVNYVILGVALGAANFIHARRQRGRLAHPAPGA